MKKDPRVYMAHILECAVKIKRYTQGGKQQFLKDEFDFVVANPPFSFKSWSTGFNPASDDYDRFEFGIPPAKNGDFAFVLHILASLKSTGKAAVNLPHGVLFRGNAEADIRREIVRRGYIKGIIGLPPNLFYGTSIPACIMVLDKEHAAARKGIFMIDASKGFIKDGNKNRLRAQDIHKIVDIFTRQVEIPRYSRMVPRAEIADPKNDFNLNIPRYIDSTEREDLQDIDAHLRGGIPDRDVDALENYWEVFPTIRCSSRRGGPATASVRVAAPLRVSDNAVRLAVISKLGWIKRQQARFDAQPRQSEREMVSGESHYFLGRRYRLRFIPSHGPAKVIVRSPGTMELHGRAVLTADQREKVLLRWYRERLKEMIPPLVEKWQDTVGARPEEWAIRKMKTKWGACNVETRRICLNLELAKKPVQCLEYIIVHELIHLLERHHNDGFNTLMNKVLPQWRTRRAELNAAPLAHQTWSY